MTRGLRRVAAAGFVVLANGARADVADFYAGKQITWILSAGAGGGYSTYAQAFAPFLTAHLPGHPNIVIQNMPGAGGVRAMQYLYANAPRDGATLGLVHSSVPFAPLFDLPGSSFDPRRMNWIGSINAAGEICVAMKSAGMRDWSDMLQKPFIVGGTGGGSQMETLPEAIDTMFGTKIKVISGYPSGAEVYLAMERGEVQGRCGVSFSSVNATRPDWFAKKLVDVPVQIALRRSPLFPDAPALAEFAKDERTREILNLLLAYQDMDRPILAPPGVPAERVAALRRAFHDAMNDPGFIAEAKRVGVEIEEVSGERLARIVEEAYALPKDIVTETKNALTPNLAGAAP